MRTILLCILASFLATSGMAEEGELELLLEVQPGRGDKPMVAIWIEDDQGQFVETIEVCSQALKYFPELREWNRQRKTKESVEIPDAVVGATIRWSGKRLMLLPVGKNGRNLLDGHYALRIESAADGGQHYRDFKIALPAGFQGGIFEHAGYVCRATVRVPGVPLPDPDRTAIQDKPPVQTVEKQTP